MLLHRGLRGLLCAADGRETSESLNLNVYLEIERMKSWGLWRWSSPCPAPSQCHGLVSMQMEHIDGAELGWPTVGLTVWVWLGEDTGTQHRPVPADCSGGLLPPAAHGPPRAASSRAVLCYLTSIRRNLEGKSLATEHLLGSEGTNPVVKGESALCYGAESPHGGCPTCGGGEQAGRRAHFTHSCAKRHPEKGNLFTSGGQAHNAAWRDCMRLVLGAQSNQKSSCKSIRAEKIYPACQYREREAHQEAEGWVNH